MRVLIGIFLIVLICSSCAWANGEHLSRVFQARMVVTIEENRSTTNLWAKEGLIRINMLGGRAFSYSITDYRQKKSWALSPEHMIYQEFPSKSLRNYVPEFFNPELNLRKEYIADEMINGINCKKYRAIVTLPDRPRIKGFLWEAIALPGYPLQWEEPARHVHVIWENSKLVTKPASFFQIPADFQEQKASAAVVAKTDKSSDKSQIK